MAGLQDTGNPRGGPTTSGTGTGKTKQTRRRQRLSCVECTRRRQKCDRQIPCGLCVSRGIPHLCKWEPIVTRPDPQRPPEGAPVTTQQQQSTIATLTARITALEDIIMKQNLELTWGGSIDIVNPANRPEPSGSPRASSIPEPTSVPDVQHLTVPQRTSPASIGGSRPSSAGSNSSDDLRPSGASPALSRVGLEVQFAAAKMAQLTLAPPNEFVGAGTIFCAIHTLGDMGSFKYPYARSGPTTLDLSLCPDENPLANPVSRLVASLPPRETVNSLIEAYYTDRDWNYSIPERWFKNACQQMWDHLDTPCVGAACQASGGCSRCTREVNPNWLALLFAVLALSPHRIEGLHSKTFFIKAMEARRLVEDTVLFCRHSSASSQSVVHGVALGCIAAALLACWLSDHGRPSDCWKLTGTAIRQAQAVGLHRDPTWYKWEKMDAQECELRVYAWWYLIIADRLNSMILGRPTMAAQGTFDVKLIPGALHGDGTENIHVHYQQSFIALCQIVDEVVANGLAILPRSYGAVLETDKKLKVWYSKLHSSLDWRRPHTTPSNPNPRERGIFYQRYISAAYFLGTLMNLHRPYLMSSPPTLRPLGSAPGSSVVQNPSRERCIEAAMELVKVLCDAHDEAIRWSTEPRVSSILFHYAYFVFDGSIGLVGAFSQDPPHPKAQECLGLIQRGMRMLEEIKQAHDQDGTRRGEANMACRALSILGALRKAGRWDERFGREDRAPAETTPSTSNNVGPATETPVDLYGMARFPLAGSRPFNLTQFSSAGFEAQPQPSTSTTMPFLNADRPIPSMFPPMNVQSGATDTGQWGDMQGLEAYMSMVAPSDMDLCGPTGASPSLVMPFDMLNSNNDIDWGAVMNSASDTGAGGNWFIG